MNNKVLKTLEFYKIINMLLDRSQSIIGKNVIKNSHISKELSEVQKLLDETDEAYRFIIKHRLPGISNIDNLDEDFKLIELGHFLLPKKLLEVWKLLNTSRSLKNIITEEESIEYNNIYSLLNSLNIYAQLERDLEVSIISAEEISDEASHELKRIRRMIKSKNDLIRDRLNQLISTSDKLMDNIYTLRDGRYVVPVRSEFKNSFKGIVHDQSSSGQTVFIEPMFVIDLNNDLKKLEIEEEKEIERILREFSKRIYEILPQLITNLSIISSIDFIFARGKLAYDMEAIKPIINDNGIISLKSAKHPLIDKDKVVPIDISLGNSFNTLVITGPNTGGKTVTLKTVGILTLMTQFGLMIPCFDNSEVAIFDEIFADIGDEQSIEQSLSTFSSHMKNIIDIINNAKTNSLILFDELGSGTDPEEGSGLSISILNYFLEKNIRTIATTHYSQLKMYAMSTENVQNGAMEFNVEKLEPTYKLIIGISGKSNAFEISKKLGLDDSFIINAKKFISNNDLSFDKLVSNVDNRRKEYEELIIEQRELLNFNKKIKQEYENKLEKFNSQKEKRIKKLEEYIENSINETNSNISNEPLMLGEEVKVLSLNENGFIQTLPDKNGNIQVKIGILKVNVSINDIIRIENIIDKSKEKTSYSKSTFIKSDKMYSNQIDVRGYNTEDAIYEIDKFLDDSFIANLNEVTIVHGKGTGILRNNITDFLKKHKLVKSFSFGKLNEGGDGATVVKLK